MSSHFRKKGVQDWDGSSELDLFCIGNVTIISFVSSVDDDDLEYLAWTTTPWTLPSNVALCVNPKLDYVRIHHIDVESKYKRDWICVESRLDWFLAQVEDSD